MEGLYRHRGVIISPSSVTPSIEGGELGGAVSLFNLFDKIKNYFLSLTQLHRTCRDDGIAYC